MKKTAVAAVLLTLAALGLVVYGLSATRLQVRSVTAQLMPASDHPAEFQRLQNAVENKSLIGIAFVDKLDGEAADYSLLVHTVELKNNGIVKADMVEVMPMPSAQDALCYTDGSAQGELLRQFIHPGQTLKIRSVLLTRNQERATTVRDLYISYYLWGNPFSQRTTSK